MDRPPRRYCYTCRKPDLLCVCADIRRVDTRFKLIVLQHPQEARETFNTARIVSLSVPSCQLLVGVDFSDDRELAVRLEGAPGPVYLLYPERGAIDATVLRERERGWPGPDPTFVLIDGTWGHARKIKNQNPVLSTLPRVTLSPRAPSRYLIRKQPRENYLSTVEAVAQLLETLEGSGERIRHLLDVFERMVSRQLAIRRSVGPGLKVLDAPQRLPLTASSRARSRRPQRS